MGEILFAPYFRDSVELPASLPTTLEMLASEEIIKGTEAWSVRKVVGVGEHFIAKYSPHNDAIEGTNLLFLERNNLQGFVPLLYAMWKEADGTLFLLTLQESGKDNILDQTRAIISQIRAIPHEDFFGAPKYPAHISGPFMTERDLLQGLVSKSRANAQDNGRHSYLADFFEAELKRVLAFDDRKPVFTHCDLQQKNILVEEVAGVSRKKEFRVSLVDWESSGWYPVYWEYFVAFISLMWEDDWCSKISGAVDTWPAEAAMMKIMHQDLWM
ncbi:hypothetical protein BJ878DRAFT_582487 [Calycina marina]|uniref:Aminoglycoside phosphotransferase domain-containing protein n=1 Tax=Calycina marina TaxID=1763456 RepID=A0A9P8CGM8_9HELO|nr:hypothetical protein BJ878DRAFT_582487 [Calycina marina]